MRKLSLQAAVLMFVFFVFILLLRTPLVKPVNPDHEYEEGSERALPIPSHRSLRREAANGATVFEIVPKDAQEDRHVGHYEIRHEGDKHTHASSQLGHIHEDSYAGHYETWDEGDRHRHTSSQQEPTLSVGGDGKTVNISNNYKSTSSQPAQSAHKDRGQLTKTSPFLIEPESRWAKLRKAITLWNRNWTWGSHPLPDISEFKAGPGSRWVTFFHDQAVVPMLLTDNSTILDCVVQEVIEEWEQDKALEYLGNIMPLEPVDLPLMVHLSSLCGFMNTPPPSAQKPLEPINVWTHGLSMLQGILPGTLWCGRSDKASVYRQLGPRAALDSCCRTHDHCPAKLLPMDTRYGVTNLSLKTMSHCSCELEFYRCLKAAQSDPLAITVGQVYFNLLKLDCLTPATASTSSRGDNNLPGGYTTPLSASSYGHASSVPTTPALRNGPKFVCYQRDSYGGCRKWVPNPQAGPTIYQFTPSALNF